MMNKIRKSASVLILIISCFFINGCEELTGVTGGKKIHLFQQALDISADLANTVHFVLPQDIIDGTRTFTDEYKEGSNGGSVEYSGTYSHRNDSTYTTTDIERTWSGFSFTFDDYVSLNGLTVESGTLNVSGYYHTVSGITNGTLDIDGTVTVSGKYEDEDVRDTITVDFDCLWKQIIDDGSTLANSAEEWDIWMPY